MIGALHLRQLQLGQRLIVARSGFKRIVTKCRAGSFISICSLTFCTVAVRASICFFICAVLLQELIEQHRVHRFHSEPLLLCHLHHVPLGQGSSSPLAPQSIRTAEGVWIELLLVAEGHWFEGEHRYS